jgi:hypothetical protein
MLAPLHPQLGPVPTDELFVALGTLAAMVVFLLESRRRGQTTTALRSV